MIISDADYPSAPMPYLPQNHAAAVAFTRSTEDTRIDICPQELSGADCAVDTRASDLGWRCLVRFEGSETYRFKANLPRDGKRRY